MASPQVGVYFVIGLVAGFLVSFFLSSFSSSYSELTKLSPSGTQKMIAASEHGRLVEVPTAAPILNTDKPPDTLAVQKTTQCNCSVSKVTCPPVIQGPPISHQQIDQINKQNENQTELRDFDKEDHHKHHDNDAIAQDLYKKVRVLVWVMTQPTSLESKARHVNITWGKRANKILFASDQYDPKFPTMPIEIPHGRDHLTAKTMAAFDYVYEHHLNEYDWFMKADDDTFVIIENLRYFLSDYDPSEPVYFGHLFKVIVKQGYYSGGGGYVLSREALKRFGTRKDRLCAQDHGAEDVEFGRCMEKLGIKTQESIDNLGRTRFHCFNPGTFLHGGYPDWFLQYDKYDGKKRGHDSVSDYAISFHYVSIKEMYDLEFYVYHLRPYGIQNGLQNLNRPRVKTTSEPLLTGEIKDILERKRNEKLNEINR